MHESLILVGLLAVVVAVALLLGASISGRRRRKQIDELMQRVEHLEGRLAREGGEVFQEQPVEPPPAVVERGSSVSPAVSADVLAGWTTHIGRMLNEEGSPRDLSDQAVINIHRSMADPIQPSGLAEDLNISLRTLERFLSRSLECSPGQLILAVKMREARRMLESGQFRVGEVAHHLAFADAAHFSRRYRQFYHCPPSRHLPV